MISMSISYIDYDGTPRTEYRNFNMNIYEKCRQCGFVCRCCSSKHWDNNYPHCQGCNGTHNEYEPANHINHCPIDGSIIKEEK